MSATLEVGHGNGHNEHLLVEQVRNHHWDVFGVNEGDELIGALKDVPDSKVVVTGASFDRAKENPTLVAEDRKLLGWTTTRVSRALGKRGSELRRVAPARTLTEVRFEHPLADELHLLGVAHFNAHPNAGPKQLTGRNPNAPIVKEYRKTMKALRKAWRKAKREGYLCVMTGDLQLPVKVRRPWSPWTQALRLNATYKAVNIDWIFVDKRARITAFQTFRLPDHTGFVASLRR